jgi:glycosyltransferase involved in cell wall biosynthesis
MIRNGKPLRVAFATIEFVTEPTYYGGLANYLYRVGRSLVEFGHEPVVVVPSDRDEMFLHEGIEVHRVRIGGGGLFSALDRVTRRRLRATLSWAWQSIKINTAIRRIHAVKPCSIIQYASCAATGLFRLRSLPSVVRISSFLPLCNDACGYARTLDVRLAEGLEEIAYRRADALFAPSHLSARAVEAATGRRVSIIETPFYLECREYDERFFRENLSGKRYLLFFGSIGLMKGAGVIADMIGDLLARHSDLHFVFAGKNLPHDGRSMMDRIREKAAAYGDRVHHFREMPHERLYPIIRNAFAVVLPSRVDNFPNTCLEAMAHERVVIGTNGTSFEQLISDGENGFLCEKDDPRDLLRVVETVLALGEPERTAIGARARERLHALRPEESMPRLIEYYHRVIAQVRSGEPPTEAPSFRRKASSEPC